MEKIERQLRRLAAPGNSAAHGDIVIPSRHGCVMASFSANIFRFCLYVPLPGEPSAARVYRGDTRPVLRAPRPLNILLRGQTKADELHIASETAREIVLGDRVFDEEVYVDTRCDDGSVKMVLNEEARRAILEIFTVQQGAVELDHVTIDDANGRVVAQWTGRGRATGELDAAQLERAVVAMDALANALPMIVATGARRPVRSIDRAAQAASVGSLIGLPLTLLVVSRAPSGTNFAGGFIGGAIVSAVLISLCYVFIRGHSDSPAIRSRVVVACVWLPLEFGTILAALVH